MGSLMPGAFHPAFVHFAIGLVVFAIGLDAYAHFTGKTGWHPAAKLIFIWGCVAVALAACTGWWDHERWHEAVPHDHSCSTRMCLHGYLGWGLTALFAVLLAWRWRFTSHLPRAFVLLALLGVVGILVQGHIGGQMVFLEGTGVRSHAMGKSAAETSPEMPTVLQEKETYNPAASPTDSKDQDHDAHDHDAHDHSGHEH